MSFKVVSEALNHAMNMEFEAIHRYFAYAKCLEHMGIKKIARKVHEISIDEMKHADSFCKRILFLDGVPTFNYSCKFSINKDVKKIFSEIVEEEKGALSEYRLLTQFAEDNADFVSAELLTHITGEEEAHFEWARQQLNLISIVGIENYVADASE